MSITVYTKPNCQPCRRTKLLIDRAGVAYEEVDITQDPKVFEAIRELGYAQAPVVVVRPEGRDEDIHWSGLRADMIDQFIGAA